MATGIVLLVVGAIFLIYGIIELDRASAMRDWPAIQGEVYSARVVEELDTGVDDSTWRVYRPEIRYSFILDGTEYAGARRSLGEPAASWRSHAETVVARYPVGQAVTVYYNPENPRDSIIERQTAKGWATFFIVIGVVVGIGGGFWAWYS